MNSIEIIPFEARYAADFERLNTAWLEKYFVVEPYDAQVLADPQRYFIDQNGFILLAREGEMIIGTIALMYHGKAIEVTKMAVDEAHQGKGIGRLLMQAALEKARQLPHEKIFLLTSSKLEVANRLYEKFGFQNMPLEASDTAMYQRCDKRWEFSFPAHAPVTPSNDGVISEK